MDSFSSAGEMSQSLELPLLLQANVDAEQSQCRQLRTFASWPFQSGAFYRRLLDAWQAVTDRTDLASAAIWFTGPGDTRAYMPWPIGLADQLHRSGHHPYLLSDLEVGPSRETAKTTPLPQSLFRRLAALLPDNPCGVGTDLEGVRTITDGGERFAGELDRTDPSWTLLLSAPLPPSGETLPTSREIDGVVLVVPFEKYPDDAVRAATEQVLDAGLTILGLISVGPTSNHGFVPQLVPAPGRVDRARRNQTVRAPVSDLPSQMSGGSSPIASNPPAPEASVPKVHRVDLRRARPSVTNRDQVAEPPHDAVEARRLATETAARIAKEVSGETAAEIARAIAREVALDVARDATRDVTRANVPEETPEKAATPSKLEGPPSMSRADAEAIAAAGAEAARGMAEEVARGVAESVAANVAERSAGSVTRITEALARQTAEKAARQAADEIARRVATEVAEVAATRSAEDLDAKIAKSEESSARASSEIAARVAEDTANRTTSEVATRIARTVASEEARTVASAAIREAIEHVTRLAAEAAVDRVRPMLPSRTDTDDYVYQKTPRSLITEVSSAAANGPEETPRVYPGSAQTSRWREQEQDRARERRQAQQKEKAEAAAARAVSPPAPLEKIDTRGEFALLDRWTLQRRSQRRKKQILGFVLVTVVVVAMVVAFFLLRPPAPTAGPTRANAQMISDSRQVDLSGTEASTGEPLAAGLPKVEISASGPPNADAQGADAAPSVSSPLSPSPSAAPPASPSAAPPPTASSTPTVVGTQAEYVVQLASFRVEADARSEAERLAALGVATRLVEVDLGAKGRWIRIVVAVGFADRTEAYRHAKELRAVNGISDAIVVDGSGRGSRAVG